MHIRKDRLGRSYTPNRVAEAVIEYLAKLYPFQVVLEPCVGGGSFLRAVKAIKPEAHISGYDLDPNAPAAKNCDVFKLKDARSAEILPGVKPYDLAVTNPPFGKIVGQEVPRDIVRAARKVAQTTAMILPLDYLTQVHWHELVSECDRICALTPRPFSHERGMVLMVWSRQAEKPATFDTLKWR